MTIIVSIVSSFLVMCIMLCNSYKHRLMMTYDALSTSELKTRTLGLISNARVCAHHDSGIDRMHMRTCPANKLKLILTLSKTNAVLG